MHRNPPARNEAGQAGQARPQHRKDRNRTPGRVVWRPERGPGRHGVQDGTSGWSEGWLYTKRRHFVQKRPHNCTKPCERHNFVQKMPQTCTKPREQHNFVQKRPQTCTKPREQRNAKQRKRNNTNTKYNEKTSSTYPYGLCSICLPSAADYR